MRRRWRRTTSAATARMLAVWLVLAGAAPAAAQVTLGPVGETATPPPGGCVTDLYSRAPGQREPIALGYVVEGAQGSLIRLRLGDAVRSLRRAGTPQGAGGVQVFADSAHTVELRYRAGLDGTLTIKTASGWRLVSPVRGRQTCRPSPGR